MTAAGQPAGTVPAAAVRQLITTYTDRARHWRRETVAMRGAGAYFKADLAEVRHLIYDEVAGDLQALLEAGP